MKIIFFGTSPFAAEILKDLVEKEFQIVAVVTRPDRKKGRSLKLLPTAVKEVALEKLPNTPIFQPSPASTPEFCEKLKELDPDLFVVVAYGEILKQNILDLPRFGAINVHASLLPKYRGAAPIHRAILDGEEESGVTIIDMVLKMDAGDMLGKSVVQIGPNMKFAELEQGLIHASQELLPSVIKQIEDGSVIRKKQDESKVTFAAKLTPEVYRIDFNRSAGEIHNQIRALRGSFCMAKIGDLEQRLKLLNSKLENSFGPKPGQFQILPKNQALQIQCGDGSLIVDEVQLEGKRAMKMADFLNGIAAQTLTLY